MCTVFTLRNDSGVYVGRNMDLHTGFGESVVAVPRNMPLSFKAHEALDSHYAFVGTARMEDNFPLLAEGVNEMGVCAAALNFSGYAAYAPKTMPDKLNLAPYEIISWVLASCSGAGEAKRHFSGLNIVSLPFSENIPVTALHWLVADKEEAFVLECAAEGVKIYENPVGVLTNEPGFDFHLRNLSNFAGLSPAPAPRCLQSVTCKTKSRLGSGAMGLPGDSSSVSRFVRCAFLRENSVFGDSTEAAVTQSFRILDALAMVKGSVINSDGKHYSTIYSCCMDLERGTYYYKTYENSALTAVELRGENLKGSSPVSFEMEKTQRINRQ